MVTGRICKMGGLSRVNLEMGIYIWSRYYHLISFSYSGSLNIIIKTIIKNKQVILIKFWGVFGVCLSVVVAGDPVYDAFDFLICQLRMLHSWWWPWWTKWWWMVYLHAGFVDGVRRCGRLCEVWVGRVRVSPSTRVECLCGFVNKLSGIQGVLD